MAPEILSCLGGLSLHGLRINFDTDMLTGSTSGNQGSGLAAAVGDNTVVIPDIVYQSPVGLIVGDAVNRVAGNHIPLVIQQVHRHSGADKAVHITLVFNTDIRLRSSIEFLNDLRGGAGSDGEGVGDGLVRSKKCNRAAHRQGYHQQKGQNQSDGVFLITPLTGSKPKIILNA